MIDRLITFSIHNKLVIGLFVAVLIGWGVYSFRHIPIDAVPDITTNQVQVMTQSPTLATQEVEQFVTFPIEVALANLPDVVEIRSMSRFGLSVVTVVFEEHVDIYLARQLISEQLKMADSEIPPEFGTPKLGPITTGLGEVYQYILHVEPGYDSLYGPMELRTINDWIVKRQLAGTPGVIEISGWGGYLKQYEVAVNPEKLRSMHLSISEIFTALERNNENAGGSYIEQRYNTYFIRGEGLVSSLEDIEKINIKTVEGLPILIRDVARVRFGHAPRYGAMTWNNLGEGVGGQALMLKGENSYEVVNAVKARIEQIRGSLPEGVVLESFIDRSELISRAIWTVSKNLIEGGLIVIFVLVLLLGNFRGGLIVASVIPLSMLFAMGMMQVFGISANLMSLGAIDFGLIVDGSVIIVESIIHRLVGGFKGQKLSVVEMDREVGKAAIRIRNSAAFGEIIILIVYLPILALVGIEGKMFRPMAQTVSFAILGALILSMTYVPMMAALFLKRDIQRKRNISDRVMQGLHWLYAPVIKFALRFKMLVIVVAIGLLLVAWNTFNKLGGEFIPTLEEGDFALHQILPTGASLAQSIEVSGKIQKILLDNFPEVEKVVTKIGTSDVPTDPMPIEVGDIMVKMAPREQWVSAKTREEMFEKMEEKLKVVPGVNYEFTQPIQMRFNELIAGIREDIAVKIFGDDPEVLFQKALEAQKIIQDIPAVGDLRVEQTQGLPQMVVTYERGKIAQYGLDIRSLNQVLQTAFAGQRAGIVLEGERRFDLVVRLEEDFRGNIDDIRNLYIPLPNGEQVPLKEVALIEFREGPVQISRENAQRRIVLGVNTRDRDVEGLVDEIRRRLDDQLRLDPGYYIRFGGQFENLVEAKKRLGVAVPAALALILVLLYFTFNSVIQAMLIFTAVPLSAIGGVFALYLRGMPFSISAGVGFIALFGVSVLNGIVLISYFNQLEKAGMKGVTKRILTGTRERLRPVVMTAGVAALGFLPMALSLSAGAEVQRPLATVVIGGLVSSTLLTLIVLPILYSLLYRRKRIDRSFMTAIVSAGFILLCGSAHAQPEDTLTLDKAIEQSFAWHPAVQAADLEIEKQQLLSPAIKELDDLQLIFQHGQFNSSIMDYQLSVKIGSRFPTAYRDLKIRQERKVTKSMAYREMVRIHLEKEVRNSWWQLAYAEERSRLYFTLEQIFSGFSEAANIRYRNGETNIMENTLANNRFQQIVLERIQAEQEVEIAKEQLRSLTGIAGPIVLPQKVLVRAQPVIDQGQFANHPELTYLDRNIELMQSQYEVTKDEVLPGIQVGYLNQQIDGISGFNGYMVGLNIPISHWAYKARRDGALKDIQIARKEYDLQNVKLENSYKKWILELATFEQKLGWYETQGLETADQLIRFSERAYRVGEIDYLQYILGLDQAQQIRTEYLETLYFFNQLVVDLNYLTASN